VGQGSPRHLELEVVAEAGALPIESVERILASRGITFELHEMAMENHASVRYVANVQNSTDLKSLSEELMTSAGQPLRSVTWSEKKWMRQ
jgi:hypothetical protein